ncbi:histidine phosphatase superfamily [Parachaetomium inaequale]|uniref:Histidine phosphatase superfamily n=1 Tax=Parachaetomium inaequale TaxID=2588326 RepID=A0AAN6PIA4_9PEZI|nr:histidine phosphatase superfamily [Parachaetomium inaequale]
MAALSTVLTLLVSSALAGPDNEHLHVESSTDRCSSTSAIAFMQGLYPPSPHVSCDSDVPKHNWCADGSVVNYPMCGYQYPNIKTLAPDRDPDSIWSHGHDLCSKQQKSMLMFSNNTVADAIHQASKGFYGSLWDKVFCEAFPRSQTNFYNALDLYDYAAYRWNHENKTDSAMTSDDLETLGNLAWQEQTLKHGHIPGSDATPNDLTSAIAGRTLASRAVALFAENIESRGERNKLNLAFTSHEPFLALFALMDLAVGPYSHLFSRLPEPGAAVTFELFSVDQTADSYGADSYNNTGQNDEADWYGKTRRSYKIKASHDHDDGDTTTDDDDNTNTYDDEDTTTYYNGQPINPCEQPTNHDNDPLFPSADELYVRFLYHDTSDPSSPPTPCPLFGSSHTSIPFKHFNATIWSIGIANATSWCDACESSDNVFFCRDPRHEHHHLLAVILSGLALAIVAGLLFILLVLT